MSLSLLTGAEHEYGPGHAVFYDASSSWAFGPVFTGDSIEEATAAAESFQAWASEQDGRDLRTIPADELQGLHSAWSAGQELARG